MRPYTIVFSPGPNWVPGTSLMEQDLEPHGLYHQAAYEAGTLLFAGPFLDDAGGVTVFLAETPEDAEMFVAEDPAVKAGIFEASLHPQHVVFNRYVKKGLRDRGPGV